MYTTTDKNGIISELSPFGTMEKIASITDTPVYGGFKEYGTRFNYGFFNYSGLYIGNSIADYILYASGIICNLEYLSISKKYDFLVNTELNKKLKITYEYTINTYDFKKNTSFFIDKKLRVFKYVVSLFIIILFIYSLKIDYLKNYTQLKLKLIL